MSSLRVPGLVLGALGTLLFCLGIVVDFVRPVPRCPPPRGMLCAAEGNETLRLLVPGMWVLALVLLLSGLVLLFLHWRREPATPDAPDQRAEST